MPHPANDNPWPQWKKDQLHFEIFGYKRNEK